MLFGRARCNPAWIAKHYDLANIQFFCTDTDYRTYTPGIYDNDEESLEGGARRKLAFALQSLRLRAGDSILDIGCGWGGMLRFAAEHGVWSTGITLSSHQHQFVTRMIEEKGYPARALYQDFFTFEPDRQYDGIAMMGVIEDLSDYHLVMKRLSCYLKPGGRVYLDFATSRRRFDTSSFITSYVWPGLFRLVYLPEFIDAVNRSPFEIVALYDDRHNYYLWTRHGYDRWMTNKAAILERTNIEQWRMLRLLIGGGAALMNSPQRGGACRVVLELTRAAR
jgi:cyclopropane-fatty-acyl-phospholipid synthase